MLAPSMTAILRPSQVQELTGFSRTALHYRVGNGLWPTPIRFSRRHVGWLSCEVERMVRVLAAGSDAEAVRAVVRQIESDRSIASENRP